MDELKALRFCEAVARTGSFTRAAEEVAIAQPALSIAIAKFERRLGVTLFHRLPRGAELTPEGRLLLARGARIFDELDSIKRELSDSISLRSGAVSIGFPPMYGLKEFPRLLAGFRARFPELTIRAIEGSATTTANALDAGAIDLAILEARRVQSNWGSTHLSADEMVIAVGRRHHLRALGSMQAQQFAELSMALLTPDFLQRQLLDAYCREHGVNYRKVIECNSVHLSVLAAEGQGVAATLLRSVVRDNRRLIALSFTPAQMFEFRLCWRTDRYLSKAASAFIEDAGTGGLSADANLQTRRSAGATPRKNGR